MTHKIETAAQRDVKIKDLARRISSLCVTFYERSSEEQKVSLWLMLDDLEKSMIDYRDYQTPWDSQIINVVENIGGRKVKTQAFSTFESVMDKARDILAFVSTN